MTYKMLIDEGILLCKEDVLKDGVKYSLMEYYILNNKLWRWLNENAYGTGYSLTDFMNDCNSEVDCCIENLKQALQMYNDRYFTNDMLSKDNYLKLCSLYDVEPEIYEDCLNTEEDDNEEPELYEDSVTDVEENNTNSYYVYRARIEIKYEDACDVVKEGCTRNDNSPDIIKGFNTKKEALEYLKQTGSGFVIVRDIMIVEEYYVQDSLNKEDRIYYPFCVVVYSQERREVVGKFKTYAEALEVKNRVGNCFMYC